MESTVFDCIVVGAGIEGSASAFELSSRQLNVLLLDQFTIPHTRGSSHGATRITRRAYHKPEFTSMMEECYRKWEELEKISGQSLYRKTGVLVIGPEAGQSLTEFRVTIQHAGVSHEILNSSQLRANYPGLTFPADYVALLEYDGGTLRADKCLSAYQTAFIKNGGRISDEEKILSITPGDTVKILTSKGTRLTRNVVFCMGPWSGDFFKENLSLNLPLETRLIKVCYWREKSRGSYSASMGFPCLLVEEDSAQYFALPADEYEGLLKFCYHNGPLVSPDQRDSVNAELCVEKCRKYIRDHLPLLEDQPAIVESCMYTMTPDRDFILDRHPAWPNLFIGAGFSGHGFKLAPAVGGIMTDLVCRTPSPHNLDLFRINRFNQVAKL